MSGQQKSTVDLAALGLNQAEITEMVVDRICSQIVREDFDSDEFEKRTNKRVETILKARIDEAIEKLGAKYIAPNVKEMIQNWQLQQTNTWGEKTGAPVSFIEYLIKRAEAYLREPVNYEGKPKTAGDSYSWKPAQERLAWMVDKHLHYSISQAMEGALKTVNGQLAASIAETVKMKLAEIKVQLDVKVSK